MILIDVLFKKENSNVLPIGEKIKLLRKAKGITQAELAEIILSNSAKISRVENGDEEYSQEELKAIKEHFEITEMPLTELECAAFKERLYIWRSLIRDYRISEAKELHKKMSPIINLEPCDPDLSMLYRLFEALLLLAENKLDAAEEKLNYFQSVLDKLNSELAYHFYHRMGSLHLFRKDYEGALKFYKLAYEIDSLKDISPEDNERLCCNIAICYTNLELPNRSIMFLSKINRVNIEKRATIANINLDIALARSYTAIGEFEEAENILNKCLVQAKGIDDNFCIVVTLFYLGLLYRRSESWEKSIEYFDQTLNIIETSSAYYPWSFYYKIRCLIGAREFSEAEKELGQAKDLYSTDDVHLILFNSLDHFLTISKRMTIYNEESVKYIETVTIPHLIKIRVSLEAINYYELLEQHYIKTRKNVKSLLMRKAICDIYERIFVNKQGGEI